ncbi:20703_t:CDS:2 [Gigaspora rosea]|nr:20703_t:CDS:2 [Gigaspora rosea]
MVRETGCYDTNRTLNPQGKDYTWSQRDLRTRIDYIWVTENLAMGLKEVKVENIATYTGTESEIEETIERSILETAMKHIPKKKICNTKSSKINRKSPRLDKIIVELSGTREYQREVGREGCRRLKRMVEDSFYQNAERIEKEKLKQIEENLEKHCQMIDGDQGRISERKNKSFFKSNLGKEVLKAKL